MQSEAAFIGRRGSAKTLLLGMSISLLFSCAPTPEALNTQRAEVARTHTSGDPLSGCVSNRERELVRLANETRAAEGVEPLHCALDISGVAQRYAEKMCADNFIAHTAPDGSTMKQRIEEGGIEYQAIAENLALGASTPAQVHERWMKSPPHRENLLNPTYSRLGTGYANCKNRHFWVQNFAN